MDSQMLDDVLEPSPLELRSHSEELAFYNYKTDFQKGTLSSTSFLHEHTHFLDHISTPYGHFLDSLTYLHADACKQLLRLFNSQGAPSLPIPLRKYFHSIKALENFLRSESGAEFDLKNCIESLGVFVVVWPLLVELERSLEGANLPTIYTLDPARALGGIRAFEAIDEHFDLSLPSSLDHLINLHLEDWDAPDNATPRIIKGMNKILYGAISLLEGRAFFIERSLGFFKKGEDPLKKADKLQRNEYFIVFAILAQRLLEIGITKHEQMLDTYLALADLALYTPIGKTYGAFRKKNYWTEIHPGYRFSSLVELLDKIGPFNRSEKMDVFEYQASFCHELGWAAPQDFLRKGAEFKDINYRATRHRQACQMKIHNPRLFINPALEYFPLPEDQEMLNFWKSVYPFYIDTQNPEKSFTATSDVPVFLERLTTAYFYSLGWSLLMMGNPDLQEHLDPAFPYHIFVRWPSEGSLSQYFDSTYRSKTRLKVIL